MSRGLRLGSYHIEINKKAYHIQDKRRESMVLICTEHNNNKEGRYENILAALQVGIKVSCSSSKAPILYYWEYI